jgi:hypothetical protein
MPGITQTLIAGGENPVGYRGRNAYTNSLIFGSTAGTTLVAGDTAKMSSLSLANIPTVGTGNFTVEYWVRHSNIEFADGIVHDFWQGIFFLTWLLTHFSFFLKVSNFSLEVEINVVGQF